MTRICSACGLQCKDTRGLNRHRVSCRRDGIKAARPRLRRGSSLTPELAEATMVDEETEVLFDNLNVENDVLLSIVGSHQIFENGGTRSSRATVSSGSATVIETFCQIEGATQRPPGSPVLHDHPIGIIVNNKKPLLETINPRPEHLTDLPDRYFTPFENAVEYHTCLWLFDSRASAGSINEFFQDKKGPAAIMRTIKSASAYKEALHNIPYGIQNDDIFTSDVTVKADMGHSLKYTVRYRSILSIIRFLLGHPPFKSHLSYAPVRIYQNEDKKVQIWNEMHTGSWWWNVQKQLPAGATVVPVILASDKTQLTQHHGDKSSHPVYITIGNLDKHTRRARKRPSIILLGFLPAVDAAQSKQVGMDHYALARLIHNKAMETMTKELVRYETEGIVIKCADGYSRDCFPVVGGFALDYEEQALITGVKSKRHCVTCQVPPDQRECLMPLERFPLRTYQYMRDRIAQQEARGAIRRESRRNKEDDKDDMDIADTESFMWQFQRSNMHEIMHIDILHQCFKGIVHRTLTDWIPSALRRRYGANGIAMLDERFAAIPAFPGLKLFHAFSAVTQWTGNEQKAMLRQLLPVIGPLLPKAAVQFVRAVVDFTLHAQYYSHDSDTLSWMRAALWRLDVLKEAFRPFTKSQNGFNIPKFHAISHYPMMIEKFGSADGYDTAMFEAAHSYLIKDWYKRTNKRNGYEQQIFDHNIRAVNVLAMQDLINLHLDTLPFHDSQDARIPANGVSGALDLDDLRFPLWKSQERGALRTLISSRLKITRFPRSKKRWRCATTVAQCTRLPHFLDALAVYVREERLRHQNVRSSNIAVNRRDLDSSWVESFLVCMHGSLNCWKAGRSDGSNMDIWTKDPVYCSPNWQQSGQWRRDAIWVQEYEQTMDAGQPLHGRLPGQVLLIFSILDPHHLTEDGGYRVYTGVFLDVYTLKNQGRSNMGHGMFEAQRHPSSANTVNSSLGYQRVYDLRLVHRSAHLVNIGDATNDAFYINSYVDWDQYVSVFDPNFEQKDIIGTQQIAKQEGWTATTLASKV